MKRYYGNIAICSVVAASSVTLLLGNASAVRAVKSEPVSALELSRAINLAAGYLERSCDTRGRIVYRVNPSSGRESPSYNIIRHAGAIYSLAMLNRFHPDEKAVEAMTRAGNFLRTNFLGPGPGEGTLLVRSRPKSAEAGAAGTADLGATGLGLVALTSIERTKLHEVPISDLEGMARFLTYLQKSDSSFYGKYRTDTGPVTNWQSLYYPGEAILGLVSLSEVDHDRRWLVAAGKGLAYLAKSRAGAQVVPPDHWALISTAEFLPFYEQSACPASREELLRHAVQICRCLLARQVGSARGTELEGSFDPDGRTAPTATCLEGLLAALEFLPRDDPTGIRAAIDKAVPPGINFLLRAQIKSGPYAGGMPGAIARQNHGENQPNPRSADVRIDYVQHALCAFLRYQKLYLAPDGQYRGKVQTSNNQITEKYTYDVVGNRLSSLGAAYTYNASNQMTARAGVPYTYDNNGNTLSKAPSAGTTSYTWDFENRLTSATLPGSGGTVKFIYDPFGRRIQKSTATGATTYVYDGDNETEQLDGAGNVLVHFTDGLSVDETLVEQRPTKTAYYEADGLGSVTSLTSPTGAIYDTYTSDSYGIVSNQTGQVTNWFVYTGRELDVETGLYYYRARYYDPGIGRFLSEDPSRFQGGFNFYSYVGNNPVLGTDPTGLSIYIVTYTYGNAKLGGGDNSFMLAALTEANEISSQAGYDPTSDIILFAGVSTKAQLEAVMNTANSLSDQYGPVDELSIYSHSGNVNGPIFPLDPGGRADNQYYAGELGPFQNLNWGPNAKAKFYGCHAATFAKYFAQNVGVSAYGYSSTTGFSSSPNSYNMVYSLGLGLYGGPLYMVSTDGSPMRQY